ncbi:MAG: hypothetical protein MMC33_007565 [Icmadophila ericetorum]|nr:hypothetical protein [Icmadophila ericetorum]
MAPRKKVGQATATTAVSQASPDELMPDGPADEGTSPKAALDPWTDEQEISLFKGIIKWKPVGMHKHFRMIALSQYLRSHGYKEQHTNIPGIWKKLGTLYNLEALDQREDAFNETTSEFDDAGDEDFVEFDLPQAEFGERMYERRFATTTSSSPASERFQPVNDNNKNARRPSTVDDSEDPRSSPASGKGTVRGTRATKVTRRSRLQEQETSEEHTRTTKGTPNRGESTQDEKSEVGDEEEGEDESMEDDTEDTPASTTRSNQRSARGTRGRGRAGRRRGGRRR